LNAKVIANKVPFNKVTVHKLGMLANLGELGALGGKIGHLTWQNV
jgi:hypothetical protein